MNFIHLRHAIRAWEKSNEENSNDSSLNSASRRSEPIQKPILHPLREGVIRKVEGGVLKRSPIDRTAAIVTSKCPWWAEPPQPEPNFATRSKPDPTYKPSVKPRKKRTMSKQQAFESPTQMHETGPSQGDHTYVSQAGLKISMIKGEAYIHRDSANMMLADLIKRLPNEEVSPVVKACIEARQSMDKLTKGLADDMREFKESTRLALQDIRNLRMNVVSEFHQMSGPLKDVKQFFMGHDYEEQISRLREFVSLCERLQELQTSGFLDAVADTIIKLDAAHPQPDAHGVRGQQLR